jgi:hypothetical protein
LQGTVISVRQWRTLGRQRGAIVVVVGLVTTARVLRSLRIDEQMILRVIVLAALTRLAQKKLADLLVRLVAWDHALASSRPLTTGDGNQTSMTRSKAGGILGRTTEIQMTTHATIPPTSNQAERALRPAKTQQKISGRLRSEKTSLTARSRPRRVPQPAR